MLRCVPRVDREEFVNVGVVLYCQQADFLGRAATSTGTGCAALAPDVDLDAVCSALAAVEAVCRGDESAGAAGRAADGHPVRLRWRRRAAPSSSPGPVHGGLTADPAAELRAPGARPWSR